MVGTGAGGNVGGTTGCFLGSLVEDTHQVALVVDALNGCCSFALVKIAHEVDVMRCNCLMNVIISEIQ